jgi:hypothetical protein
MTAESLRPSPFGSCCRDLKDALEQPPNSFFRVEDCGVLYVTIGYVQTDQGPGFFDQAVIYCPFCGRQLQSRADVAAKSECQ